jgi:hypothetical protein
MPATLAQVLLALGIAHTVFGLVRFRAPLADALRAGFVGQFEGHEARRAAFWFLAFGGLLMLAGQLALRAAASGDLPAFTLTGLYMLAIALVGVPAFPKSPLWLPLLLAPAFIACGQGWLR